MNEKAFIGKYLPVESLVHKLDPRTKLLLSIAYMVVVFVASGWPGMAVCAVFTLVFYSLAHISPIQAIRSILPLLFVVVLTALLNLVFVQGGQVYFQWWFIRISELGVHQAAFISARLTLLLLGMSLLTLTTTNLDITEAFERLLSPFSKFGFPAHELAMVMGIALRFLPQFSFEFHIIYRAQISRGAHFTANPFRGGMATLSALMVPMFASAFRHADTLSAAMEARCYHGGVGRTRLHPLKFTARDAGAVAAVALMLVSVLLANMA